LSEAKNNQEVLMAAQKFIVLPGGRVKKWKNRNNERWHFYIHKEIRCENNKRERATVKNKLIYGEALASQYCLPNHCMWGW
jgi:hypothetical protein